MTYEMALDYEQEQCELQGQYAQDYSDLEAQASASRGPGVMCSCGNKTSEDCKSNCLNW
jgi:hypothetical protein